MRQFARRTGNFCWFLHHQFEIWCQNLAVHRDIASTTQNRMLLFQKSFFHRGRWWRLRQKNVHFVFSSVLFSQHTSTNRSMPMNWLSATWFKEPDTVAVGHISKIPPVSFPVSVAPPLYKLTADYFSNHYLGMLGEIIFGVVMLPKMLLVQRRAFFFRLMGI